jgi:type I restriction-modification system DNA methylase subunit
LGVPKPTEMTIRNFLLKELEKRGVKVNTEISYTTPIGRLMPDMLLYNGAEYVVETKLGAEAKLLDAMVQLYDYSKYTQTKGGFAVLFPKELRRPWGMEILEKIVRDPKLKYITTATFKDARPSQRFVGNLSQMADWIAGQVLRPPSVEADTSFAIKVLTEAVEAMTASVKALKDTELEDIFGGKTVFENILQYEEGRYPLDEMKQAATYLLVNQIIFYHVLSRMDLAFEDIDEDKIGKPNDLLRYFDPVLEKDYSSIFGFDVASRLPESSTKIIKKVLMAVKALAPEKIGHDVLGKVFHELIPFNIRKAVAAFYTNNEAAEILTQLSIDDPNAKVMDLAVGSGTLLVAAYRRKRELKKKLGTFDLSKDHKRFLEKDLTGIDIMPFAAHLAVMHLSLQALLSETEKVRIAVWDSTELKSGMNIPAIHSELKAAYKRPTLDMFKEGVPFLKDAYVKKGAITFEGVGGEEIPLEKVDLVIMNPPFTRQERLPKDYKNALTKRLQEYDKYLHGRMGLYGYFIFLADRFTKENGRIAFVLPASVLRVQSTLGIRKFLIENYHIEYIITTWQRAAFSEGAQFREVLIVAKKLGDKLNANDYSCGIVKLRTLPTGLKHSKEMASKIESIVNSSRPGTLIKEENMTIKVVPMRELEQNHRNMFRYISSQQDGLEETWNSIISKAKELALFKDVLKEINGRIFEGTRARSHMIQAPIGSLFILRDVERANKREDRWVLKGEAKRVITAENLITHDELTIPKKSLHFGLRRLSGTQAIDLSRKLDFVLVGSFKDFKNYLMNRNIKRIIKQMPKWRKYIEKRLSKLAVAFRFDISAKGTSLFAWYSSSPMAGCGVVWNIEGLSKEYAKIFSMWFNSTVYALQIYLDRVETRGAWMQLHKYVMDDLYVIHPLRLSKSQVEAILKTFKEVKDVAFPSFLEQLKGRFPARVVIDKAILRVLGFSDNEIDRILDYLYPALVNEIEQLKTLMAG